MTGVQTCALPISAAIGVGLLIEILKYLNFLTWPWFSAKLAHEYGPFAYAVAIVMWSFLGSMLLLGGAEWASRGMRESSGASGVAEE